MADILVVKIGGSTLGSHDTTLKDLVALQRRGLRPVVVHGGGALVSEWLSRHNVPTRFERGLRVTDRESLEVVVAVLAGLVNKELVASMAALGGSAAGLSGVDGGLLRARVRDPALGFVGDIVEVDTRSILRLVEDGVVPVVAPVVAEWGGGQPTGKLLNSNADTAAGALATALGARWLLFLTDVPGVRSDGGQVMARISGDEAVQLIESGVVEGGMIPKVEACLQAARSGSVSVIADGRREQAVISLVEGKTMGTIVG